MTNGTAYIGGGLKKVCFLLPTHWSATMGGAEFQTRQLLQLLYATGKYDIYYVARNARAPFEHASHKVVKIGKRHMLSKYGPFFDARQVLKHLSAIKPDLIYQRVGCSYTGIAAYYAKKNKCKLVWHISSTDDVTPIPFSLVDTIRQPHRFLEKTILEYGIKNIDETIVQSEDQRELLKKYYKKNASKLVRNFVEISNLEEKKDDPTKVLWIGNLKGVKQPHVFVNLASELAVPGEIEFFMIGAPFHKQSVQDEFEREVRTIEGLHYLGQLSQEQVNQQLASAHLLVNTSIYEGFSNTFIQAWMHCVPVVSLNVNPDQLLSRGNLGLCSGGNEALINDVRDLHSNPQIRKEIGQEAREFAIEHFSMKNAECLELYLAELLKAD